MVIWKHHAIAVNPNGACTCLRRCGIKNFIADLTDLVVRENINWEVV